MDEYLQENSVLDKIRDDPQLLDSEKTELVEKYRELCQQARQKMFSIVRVGDEYEIAERFKEIRQEFDQKFSRYKSYREVYADSGFEKLFASAGDPKMLEKFIKQALQSFADSLK